MISLMFFLDTCTYDYILDLEANLEAEFFLKNLDFARTILLDFKGMGGKTLEILAYFSLVELSRVVSFVVFILN